MNKHQKQKTQNNMILKTRVLFIVGCCLGLCPRGSPSSKRKQTKLYMKQNHAKTHRRSLSLKQKNNHGNQWLICEGRRPEVATAKPNLPKKNTLIYEGPKPRKKKWSFAAVVGSRLLYTIAEDGKRVKRLSCPTHWRET